MILKIASTLLLFLSFLPAEAFGQDPIDHPTEPSNVQQPATRIVFLTIAQMNEQIVARQFPDIPTHVSTLNEQGRMLVHVRIDTQGNAQSVGVGVLSELSPTVTFRCPKIVKDDVLSAYVRNSVLSWRFRPLTVDGEPVPYRGYITVVFWYGSFLEKVPSSISVLSDLPHSTRR